MVSELILQPAERILARTLLHEGKTLHLALIETDGSHIFVSPFDRETANTIFMDGVVAVVSRMPTADECSCLEKSQTDACHLLRQLGLFDATDASQIRKVIRLR